MGFSFEGFASKSNSERADAANNFLTIHGHDNAVNADQKPGSATIERKAILTLVGQNPYELVDTAMKYAKQHLMENLPEVYLAREELLTMTSHTSDGVNVDLRAFHGAFEAEEVILGGGGAECEDDASFRKSLSQMQRGGGESKMHN